MRMCGGGVVNDIERIWTRARDLYGHVNDRRVPSAGLSALLLALLDGEAHGSELARRAGLDQSNATAVHLPKLRRMRLVDGWEVVGIGHQGGGRRASMWALTPEGRALAGALLEERAVRT